MRALMVVAVVFASIVFSYQPPSSDAADFDGFHNTTREWWNVDAFIHGEGNYSLTASFEYERETPAANLFLTFFDWDQNGTYDFGSYGDNISSIKCQGDDYISVSYGDSWLMGAYPHYTFHFERENFVAELNLTAISSPQFVAEEEGGMLPMGMGYYRYLFIPKCSVTGWIIFNGARENVEGIAYYEHVWGNWSYHHPMRGASIKPYVNLTRWWIENANISMNGFVISSNNPFGYDWAWIVFDNGWTLFYGTIPFWIDGFPFSIFYLYDGEKIREFGKISYEYIHGVFCDDTYIPTAIKVHGEGNGELFFEMHMSQKPHIYRDKLTSLLWKELILYESPGKVSGFYMDGGKRVNLTGRCEMEMERQVSVFGYNLAGIVKTGKGFEFVFLSTHLNVSLKITLTLFPFSIDFSFSHIR